MTPLQNALPIRWISGPLEIANRGRKEALAPGNKETFERWHDPAALEMLRGSPINCLVVSWAAGIPEDAAQQKTAAPLLAAARARGLSIVGWTEGATDPQAAIAAAKSAGLSAIALQNFTGQSDFPVISWGDQGGVPWAAKGPVLAVTHNVWPGVSGPTRGADASAGPTSLPWLDSNGWFIQMARARVETPLWLMFDPPGKGMQVLPQRYVTAICDSEAAGARWVISLDDNLRSGLAAGNTSAQESLRQIGRTAAFFESRRDWRSYHSLGLVGVISDFTGENFDGSGEILNLMARRDLLFRVIWQQQALERPFTGLKALVYPDNARPPESLRQKILKFVEQGGLLIAGAQWASPGKPANPDFDSQFDVRSYGKGRLATARKEMPDAYEVAVETQFLLSHRNDLMKIYNSASSGCTRFTGSPDGKRAVLQGVSFADRRASGAKTVWIRDNRGNARLWVIGADPVPIPAQPSEEYAGVEYDLPEAASAEPYFALELGA
jgi:hypothetical protein